MGLRIRRSIRLLPGIRLNVSGRSTSLSFGGRGAHVSVGSRGTRTSVGIPGTGISQSGSQGMPQGGKPGALWRAILYGLMVLVVLAAVAMAIAAH